MGKMGNGERGKGKRGKGKKGKGKKGKEYYKKNDGKITHYKVIWAGDTEDNFSYEEASTLIRDCPTVLEKYWRAKNPKSFSPPSTNIKKQTKISGFFKKEVKQEFNVKLEPEKASDDKEPEQPKSTPVTVKSEAPDLEEVVQQSSRCRRSTVKPKYKEDDDSDVESTVDDENADEDFTVDKESDMDEDLGPELNMESEPEDNGLFQKITIKKNFANF